MKPSRILPFTFLFATATVFGQSLILQGNRPALGALPVWTIAGDCPVGLQVDHGSWFERREVAGASKPGLQQHIHLTLTNLHPQKIVSVAIDHARSSSKGEVFGRVGASSRLGKVGCAWLGSGRKQPGIERRVAQPFRRRDNESMSKRSHTRTGPVGTNQGRQPAV